MATRPRYGKNVVHCKHCRRHVDECGPLTWKAQCLSCAEDRMTENVQALVDHEGDAFERWKSAILRGVQRC